MSELEPGARLGRYRLDRVIGSGGMGVVWAAHDFDLDRAIAIKVIGLDHAMPALRARLLREARAMARLKHPNVLTVFEVGSDHDRDFIAMELVDGGSLDAWLADGPPVAQVYDALLAAGHGLAAAHTAGLVHRDFKPHNVLRSHDGRVLVTDFGLARGLGEAQGEVPVRVVAGAPRVSPDANTVVLRSPALDDTLAQADSDTLAQSNRSGSLDEPLTQTGALIGTPSYMAPEQFTGAPCDPRTDQFAFAVTAWQALTGERPYRGTTIEELLAQALEGAIPESDLPADVHDVLARGLAPDPAKRWPDLEAMLAALARARHARRRRTIVIGAALAVVGLAIGAYLLATREEATAATSGPCASPETALARAWSPALHDDFVRALPGFDNVARWFDRYAANWLTGYRAACQAQGEKLYARVGCFLGVRDALAEERALLVEATPDLAGTSPATLLPELALCTGAVPIAPPSVPDALRTKIRALRGRALRMADPQETAALVDEAKALGWRPIVAELLMHGGFAAERTGKLELERELLGRAITEAQLAQHPQIEDLSRIALLALALLVLDDPDDGGEFARKLEETREAVAASGDAPAMRGMVELLEVERLVGQHRPGKALAQLAEIQKAFVTAGDLVRAAQTVRVEVAARLATDQPGDREAAQAITETLFRLVRAASDRTAYDILVDVRRELAWRDNRYDDAHGDDRGRSRPPAGDAVQGHVFEADGTTPVADAVVVAWEGVLGGDARRIYARRDSFMGDVATTAKDGSFWIKLPPHGAIMAERDVRRSVPRLVNAVGSTAGPLELKLGPTTKAEFAPKLLEDASLAMGCAWFGLDDTTAWVEDAPIGTPFDHLPVGAFRTCVRDVQHRRDAAAAPSPAPLDVILRNGERGMRVLAFSAASAPTSAAELDRLAAASPTLAWGDAETVGAASVTDAGRALRYVRGDLHVVLEGLGGGAQIVCAIGGDKLTCAGVEMPAPSPGTHDAKALAVVLQIEATHQAQGTLPKPSDGR